MLLQTYLEKWDKYSHRDEVYEKPEELVFSRLFQLVQEKGIPLHLRFSEDKAVSYQSYLIKSDDKEKIYVLASFEEDAANEAMLRHETFSLRSSHNRVDMVFSGNLAQTNVDGNFQIEYPTSFICKSTRRENRHLIPHEVYIPVGLYTGAHALYGRLMDVSLSGARMIMQMSEEMPTLFVGDVLQVCQLNLEKNLVIETPVKICGFIPTAHNPNIVNIGVRFLVLDFKTTQRLKQFCRSLSDKLRARTSL